MPITQVISALPAAPSTTDPANFDTEGDAFVAALSTLRSEINTFSSQANTFEIAGTLSETQGTSSTSNSIGTGAKTFTVDAGKSWVAGMWVLIADTADPATNYMAGAITSYSGTSLVVSVSVTGGSGTKTAWTISQTFVGGLGSLGTGVATFLGTPSSANLLAAVTDETGTGSLVFATAPTLSGPTINDGYTEEVYAIPSSTTPALSPTNGSIQTWTLTGNSTPTAGTWAAGQSLTLMVDDGTAYTITWTSVAVTWKTDSGSAPTLNTSGYTVIQLWKVGSTIYGARVGNA